ncbi:MAG: hypothetical protein JSU68_04130, partial [Phycisphaerales bacterium]
GRHIRMRAHLARHMSAAHGRKKTLRRAKRGKRRVVRAKAKRRVGRPPVAGSAPRAVRELKAYCRKLTAQRDALDAQIAAVEKALDAVG